MADPDPVELGWFTVPADHPCLDGHFPDHRLVPGVVLADQALSRLGAHFALGRPLRLQSVKFLLPVLPGEQIRLICRPATAERIGFACLVGGRLVASGMAVFAAAPA